MNSEVTLTRDSCLALMALCREYLEKGGNIPGIKDGDLDLALAALAWADRIIIERE